VKERAKSFFLVLLVVLSLLLTYQLWFKQQPEEEISEDLYEPAFFEEPRSLPEMIVPRQILLLRDDVLYQLGPGEAAFQGLWEEVSALLQQLAVLSHHENTAALPPEKTPDLTVQFAPPLPTGPGSPWLAANGTHELSELSFWHLDNQLWIAVDELGAANHRVYAIPGEHERFLKELYSAKLPSGKVPCRQLDIGALSAALEMEIRLEHTLYVPAGEVYLPELILKQEIPDQQAFLQTFFVDHSLVRVISERDGGLIYSDGEKGLRLSDGLDFSHPQLEQQPATSTYPAAIHSAGRYLAYYGGWPDWLYLDHFSKIRPAGAGREIFRSSWSAYYEGYPFAETSAVRMFFNDGGLVEYQRYLFEPLYPTANTIAAAGYLEALITAVSALQELDSWTEEPLILKSLALQYWVDQTTVPPRGVPVWSVHINEAAFILEAGELAFLKELAQ
jgi:regulatory protein YycH of two-component signal transduction system YycFG